MKPRPYKFEEAMIERLKVEIKESPFHQAIREEDIDKCISLIDFFNESS